MADDKKKPSHDVFVVLEPRAHENRERWVRVGAAWTGADAITLTLEAQPTEWGDPHFERRLVLRPRVQERSGGASANRNARR